MIYLKSGHTIEVVCEKWTFERNYSSGEFTGYKFKGLREPKRISIAHSQIAAYIVKNMSD